MHLAFIMPFGKVIFLIPGNAGTLKRLAKAGAAFPSV